MGGTEIDAGVEESGRWAAAQANSAPRRFQTQSGLRRTRQLWVVAKSWLANMLALRATISGLNVFSSC